MATRAERRKAKRQQRKQEQQETRAEAAKASRNKRIAYAIGGVIAIAILAVLLWPQPEGTPTGDGWPATGLLTSDVEMVVFGDFRCPYTKQYVDQSYEAILENYGDKIRYVFRPMPTGQHENDREAMMAAYCAEDQGLFWEYHDLLFSGGGASNTDLKGYAQRLGLDQEAFDTCLDSGKYEDRVREDYSLGKKHGIRVTPTIFINGIRTNGVYPYTEYANQIEHVLQAG